MMKKRLIQAALQLVLSCFFSNAWAICESEADRYIDAGLLSIKTSNNSFEASRAREDNNREIETARKLSADSLASMSQQLERELSQARARGPLQKTKMQIDGHNADIALKGGI